VADAVAATLARIGPQPASLARAGAVLGDGTALDLAAALAGLPVADAAAAAAQLERAGLVQDARELRFRHPILAGAVASTLSARERAAAHATAAALLRARGAGPERVALQLLHASPGSDPAVVDELRLAAAHASDRGALTTAAVLLDRALAEPPDAQARGEVLLELGRAEQATGQSTVAFAHLDEAHRCAADPLTRARAITLLGASPGGPAQRRQIADMAEAVLPEVEALDADLALRLRGILAFEGRGGALPALTGATAAEASLLGHLVLARMVPGARAAEVGDLARRAANQVDALLAEGGSPLPFVGMVLGLRWSHQLDEAERLTTRAIAAARRRGSPTDFATSMSLRALIRRSAGRLRDAEADARSALAAALDPDWLFASGIAPLVLTLVDQGRADEAMTEFGAVVTGELPEGPPMLALVLARMTARAARREHADALNDWDEALRRAQPRGPTAGWIEDLAVIADVHAATGDGEAAEALAMQASQLAQDWGTPGARGRALHIQARVCGGGESIDLLRQAVELLSESPVRLEDASARVSLGAALRRAGHRVDSRAPLREGYELAHRCGAEGLAEAARSELRASGIRLRREPASGADALTPSERRIADMAAAGLSNPEIAQELFLTVKTIEMHLTRVYRKLDIGRRAELTAALRT
jgi:DNA-binding CsgD family transcriptional regulator